MFEVLSPAGDMECLKAAVNSGADAVYIGGLDFSARSFAKNFSHEEIKEAADYCHLRRARLYVAMNTMLKQSEFEKALDEALFLRQNGVDALIVADIGLAGYLAQNTDIPLHASTQMCVHNKKGAQLLKDMGFSRVVLARELSIDEIKDISDIGIETEVFVHGALCSSVSGICLMSSFIGQRSGNRGKCAQPCRLPYKINGKEQYYLSTADLCAIEKMPELIKAGVTSFKIEGRMKKCDYVSATAFAYSSAKQDILAGKSVSKDYKNELSKHYNRTFTCGYLEGKTDVCAPDRPDNRKSEDEDKSVSAEEKKTYKLTAEMFLAENSQPQLRVFTQDKEFFVMGENALERANKPVDKENIIASLKKTGGTPFEFESVDVDIFGNPFISKSGVNTLRRDAIDGISSEILKDFEYSVRFSKNSVTKEEFPHKLKNVFAQVSDVSLAEKCIKHGADRIYFAPFDYVNDIRNAKSIFEKTGVKPYMRLVPFIKEKELLRIADTAEKYKEYFGGVLCGNFSQVFMKDILGRAVIDIYSNIANSEAVNTAKEMGFCEAAVSSELSQKDILGLPSLLPLEMFAYGHIPLMWIFHDVYSLKISDRKGYNYILDSFELPSKLYSVNNPVLLCLKEITKLYDSIDSLRVVVSSDEEADVLKLFRKAIDTQTDVAFAKENTTQGHFKRGV